MSTEGTLVLVVAVLILFIFGAAKLRRRGLETSDWLVVALVVVVTGGSYLVNQTYPPIMPPLSTTVPEGSGVCVDVESNVHEQVPGASLTEYIIAQGLNPSNISTFQFLGLIVGMPSCVPQGGR